MCRGVSLKCYISLIRVLQAAKRGAKRAEEKKNTGWFGGWFGGGKKKDEKGKAKEEKGIEDQFYEQFTADEKNKLYEAIGYQENEADPTLPKEVGFVSSFMFSLTKRKHNFESALGYA